MKKNKKINKTVTLTVSTVANIKKHKEIKYLKRGLIFFQQFLHNHLKNAIFSHKKWLKICI